MTDIRPFIGEPLREALLDVLGRAGVPAPDSALIWNEDAVQFQHMISLTMYVREG